MGLERVLLALEDEGMEAPSEAGLEAYVVALGERARAAGTELVRTLRAAGVAVDAPFEERPLKAQLKMADRASARYAAIIGDRELEGGVVTLRRLSDGVQEEVALGDVVNWLAQRDGATTA
jgi:histidyl-tRNA synthetase